MEIKLNETDLKELNDFFQEMPTKYGSQLINFFNKKIQEQQPPAEETEE
jgi:hypothetical protein